MKRFSFNKVWTVLVIVLIGLISVGATRIYFGATNFDRLVLGSANYGEDPNPTADLTLQNDEYISNSTDGRLSFGAANLLTTGTVGGGAATFTSMSAGVGAVSGGAATFSSVNLSAPYAFTAGFSHPTSSTHIWTAGGSVVLATSGTDAACSNGDRYWSEIMIPYNMTVTGVAYLVGSVGGTDSVVVQLLDNTGAQVATSRAVGAVAVIVGTTAQFQSVAFTAPYVATGGLYYVSVQFNGTTAKFRTYPIPGSKFIAGTVAGTWGTKANITPGTSFTADKGPICHTY